MGSIWNKNYTKGRNQFFTREGRVFGCVFRSCLDGAREASTRSGSWSSLCWECTAWHPLASWDRWTGTSTLRGSSALPFRAPSCSPGSLLRTGLNQKVLVVSWIRVYFVRRALTRKRTRRDLILVENCFSLRCGKTAPELQSWVHLISTDQISHVCGRLHFHPKLAE